MTQKEPEDVSITQSVAILIDGNNIERSIHEETKDPHTMLNFDILIPKLLDNRGLNRLIYFREGKNISFKLKERLHQNYHGSVRPCHKSADIPLTITASQLASKVDTIIIMSGDSDYVELVRHLKGEGVRVEIASIPRTTAQVLIDEADYHHTITKEYWFSLSPKLSSRHGKKSKQKTLPANVFINRMSQSNSRIVKPSPYITPAGYKRLTDEYESLWSKRKEVTRALSAAAAEGDRSENAEYIYRKKELRALDHRIRYLQKRLPVLNIVTEINNTRQIYFGAKIVLQDSSGKQITVKIAGPDELDDNDIHISVDSPLARALLNRTFNEEISYQIDRKKISYKIIDITYEKS